MLNYHIVWKRLHFLSSAVQVLVISGLFLAVFSTEVLNIEGQTWGSQASADRMDRFFSRQRGFSRKENSEKGTQTMD